MTNQASILVLVTALAVPAVAHAVPDQLGLTARVADDGVPLTGTHAFVVSLHDAATGGTEVWTETLAVEVEAGLAYLTLGADNPLDADVLDGGPLWLALEVDGTAVEPRLAVTSAAYAIRAGVAEDAELLGGRPASAFLPAGAALACTGTDKVSSIDPVTGSVVCGADVDTSVALAGSGSATTAARSDHTHAGTYLPIAGAGTACTGTQKVTGVNNDGTVTCAADVDTDTNTTYTNGAGLNLSAGTFSVNFAAVASSSHTHGWSCPIGYTAHVANPLGPTPHGALCTQAVAQTTTYSIAAQSGCASQGGQLCTYAEVSHAVTVPPQQPLVVGYWLADRVADNVVLRVNSASNEDNFDEAVDVSTQVFGTGYYCCQRAR